MTNRILIEVIPNDEIEIVNTEEDFERLKSHSIVLKEKFSSNVIRLHLEQKLLKGQKNQVDLNYNVELDPIIQKILLRSCSNHQKHGHYMIFIQAQVFDLENNKILLDQRLNMEGAIYHQSESERLISHGNYEMTNIASLDPLNLAIISANYLDKSRIIKYTQSLQDYEKILSTIVLTIINGDY
ncbi:UNKNOWN [Stylonychia lemnae]|uniref:Uncharacterized protein n=1 Tax=Stylonychia lemnae TaxID=5949 RepID=A0A078AYI5_STYLE|nr:UNKNOWN [Stylonychia lemnae]|eukprot:CDW87229.1 UNKNOWN [Stylonychia lemnae]